MNTPELIQDNGTTETDLTQLQLQIARRADELARANVGRLKESNDLDCWLQAEREIIGRMAEPAAW
jgi:hypothetical protein